MIKNYFVVLLDWWRRTMVLREKETSVIFKEREIWWCSVGMNIGVEIYGKGSQFTRPVLIFRKFNKDSFLGIPLTSQPKEGIWYVPLHVGEKETRAILSQARCLDSKRLVGRMGTLSDGDFSLVKSAFLDRYGS